MSQPTKDSQAKLVKKAIRSIAAYRQPDGTFDFVPLTGNVDPKRELAFEIAATPPAYKFGVQIGTKVLPLGLQWPSEPVRDWQALADKVAAEYYAEREREAQKEKQCRTIEKARKALLTATPREDDNFSFAAERETFVTPNRFVALQALNQGGKFLDVVRDAAGNLWYRFGDPEGTLRDNLCPSCGNDDVIEVSDSTHKLLVHRVCRSQSCNFRWAKDTPQRCPRCGHRELSVVPEGNEVYISCHNRSSCTWHEKLGRLPRVPANMHDAERIAVGVNDVEDYVET